MPELVMGNAAWQPETVAYHELPAMLPDELQKQQATIEKKQAQIEELRARLAERDSLGAQVAELQRLVQGLLADRRQQ